MSVLCVCTAGGTLPVNPESKRLSSRHPGVNPGECRSYTSPADLPQPPPPRRLLQSLPEPKCLVCYRFSSFKTPNYELQFSNIVSVAPWGVGASAVSHSFLPKPIHVSIFFACVSREK